MSSIFLLLQKVHALPYKMNYSELRFYTGGIDINAWSSYSKKEQQEALKKDWYLYFSFRNPKTNKLVRQQNIKAGINIYKDKKRRHEMLKILAESLTIVLEEGYNPYRSWHKSQSLMSYLDTFEANAKVNNTLDENKMEWLKWARKKADWYDPFIESEDELFKDVGRDTLEIRKKIGMINFI